MRRPSLRRHHLLLDVLVREVEVLVIHCVGHLLVVLLIVLIDLLILLILLILLLEVEVLLLGRYIFQTVLRRLDIKSCVMCSTERLLLQ